MTASLSIELPKLFYTTGEVVHGKIVYTPKTDRRIHGIHIHFSGFEFCENHVLADVPFQKKWILDGATTVFGHKCIINRSGHQTSTHRYSESEGVLIKAGQYKWPFSFQIPKNIPPSCDYKNGKVLIDYTVSVIVDIPWAKSMRCVQHLRIGLPYVLDPDRPPNIIREEKSFLFHHHVEPQGLGRPVTLRIEGWVDKPVTYSGDKITVHVVVDNNSGRHVQSLKVKLKQLWSYGNGYFEKFTITKIKHKDRKFPLASGLYETDIAMVVPNCDLRPTIQNASLIRVSYHITIIGTVRAGGALRVRIPIIVASFPPVLKGHLSPKPERKIADSKQEKKEQPTEEQEKQKDTTEDKPQPVLIDWDSPAPGQDPSNGMFLAEPLVPQLTRSPPMARHASEAKRPYLDPSEFSVDTDAFDFFNDVKPSELHLNEIEINAQLASIQNQVVELESSIQWASSGQLEHAVDIDPNLSDSAARDALSRSVESVSDAIKKLLEASKQSNKKDYMTTVKLLGSNISTLTHDAKMVAYHIKDPASQQAILQYAKVISLAGQGKDIVNYDPFSSIYSQDFMVNTMNRTVQNTLNTCTELVDSASSAVQETKAKATHLSEEQNKISKALEAFNNPFGDSNEQATFEDLERKAQTFATLASQLVTTVQGTLQDVVKGSADFTQATRALFKDAKGIAKSNRHVSQALFDAGKAAGNAALRLMEAARNATLQGEFGSDEIRDCVRAVHEQRSRIVATIRQEQKRRMEELRAQQMKEELKKEEERQRKEEEQRQIELQEKLALEDNAQKELNRAAEAISKAAERMKQLLEQTSKRSLIQPEDVFEPHHVDHKYEVIHASGSVADAIAELLQAASLAQAERAQSARETNFDSVYHKDPIWTEGLISAAKHVVSLIEKLVEATSSKELDEEMIVSIARAISAATAQLMSAERAKGAGQTEAHRKLVEAARAVAVTTSELVHKIKDAAEHTPEPPRHKKEKEEDDTVTTARVKELEAAARIARLEKELERARLDMLSLRKAKYSSEQEQ